MIDMALTLKLSINESNLCYAFACKHSLLPLNNFDQLSTNVALCFPDSEQ